MNTKDNSGALYRPCVGIALFNKNGKIFVGERIDTPGAWQMPQGGIDENEDLKKAAFRELEEETGIRNAKILKIAEEKIRYDVPSPLVENLWQGNYAGQEQTWIAMRFTGEDNEINLNAHTPPEFKAWKWIALEDTPDLIVPFKKETYEKVIEMFAGFAAP